MKKWKEKSDIEKSISLIIFATVVTMLDIVLIVIGTMNIVAKFL